MRKRFVHTLTAAAVFVTLLVSAAPAHAFAYAYTTTWPGIGSSAYNKEALQCLAAAWHRYEQVTCTMTGGTIYDRTIDCETVQNAIHWHSAVWFGAQQRFAGRRRPSTSRLQATQSYTASRIQGSAGATS